MTTVIAISAVVLMITLIGPIYRVARGPTVYDRMVGVGTVGTTTLILVCLSGWLSQRLDMFIDIAIAYAMLNFVGALVVAKYLNVPKEDVG